MIYGVFMAFYLFHINQALPHAYVNGPADPSTFMTQAQLHQATIYSRIKDLLFFIGVPFEWAIYLIILGFGFSTSFIVVAKKFSKKSLFIQSAIFVLLMNLLIALLMFPLQYYSYKVSRDYGINIQPFNLWLWDKGKSFLVDFIINVPVVWLLYTIIRKSQKRWWFYFWLISIPLTIFVYFVQPVIIDPIFNEFQPLQNQELKQDILAIAKKANIPTNQVYQVNMSKKTTAMNAYVTGIGSNARIVLWDTTLEKLNKDEILFIMAHEMGHYVYHHIYWMLFGTILSSFFLFYIGYKLLHWLIMRYGDYWGIKKIGEINSLPLILLILSVLTFAVAPIENTVSRASERAADAYGIKMTHNKEAATSAFQKLAVDSLVEPNPPKLVKIFLYTHPTMVERLYTINHSN